MNDRVELQGLLSLDNRLFDWGMLRVDYDPHDMGNCDGHEAIHSFVFPSLGVCARMHKHWFVRSSR